MERRGFLKSLACGALAAAVPRLSHAAPKRKPNIVFVLADDMGWMDSTPYGSRYYETPHLERLARQGLLFTDAYAANPLCSPTRASLMTGKYPARLHFTTPAGHLPPLPPGTPLVAEKAPPNVPVLMPITRRHLPPAEHTLAEALKAGGYRTGFVGKWHLGLRPEHWPEAQGFEFSFHGAPDPGPPSYFSPYGFKAGTAADGPKGEYITDRITGEAVRYIERHKAEPFFLCLWHYAVHGPWGHKEEITRTFADKKDPRGKQANPVMASMLKSMDESLGRVMDTLDRLGLADDTLLIFFSDNGGNIHSRTQDDRRSANVTPKHPKWVNLQSYRKYAGFQPPTNNAPLRGGKAHIYEGGTREPCIIRWPGVVKPGSRTNAIISSIDFYPTLLEVASAKPKPGQILDGVSILPVLRGGTIAREAIFCHFPHGLGRLNHPSTYVRQGDWKLIRFYHRAPDLAHEYELYNLKNDIGETTNLAARLPERVQALDALIEQHLKDTGAAVPKKNPAYRPPPPTVGGWRPLNTSILRIEGGAMIIEATAKRCQMMRLDLKAPAGKYLIKTRLRTKTGRAGIFYWATAKAPNFARERRSDFQTAPDGAWHEHAVPFEADAPVRGLRLDFSTTPGRVDVDWVRLCAADGSAVQAWEFE